MKLLPPSRYISVALGGVMARPAQAPYVSAYFFFLLEEPESLP